MIEKRSSFYEGVYKRIHPAIREDSFIGIWELFGGDSIATTRFLSLEKRRGDYHLGKPIGYLQEKYYIIKKTLNRISLEDLQESGFIYLEEELKYCDELSKTDYALKEYAEMRRNGSLN